MKAKLCWAAGVWCARRRKRSSAVGKLSQNKHQEWETRGGFRGSGSRTRISLWFDYRLFDLLSSPLNAARMTKASLSSELPTAFLQTFVRLVALSASTRVHIPHFSSVFFASVSTQTSLPQNMYSADVWPQFHVCFKVSLSLWISHKSLKLSGKNT